MDELAIKVLGPLGLSGLVILVLAYAVWHLYKQQSKMTESRLADVPILIKALDNNTQATRENAAAIIARNLITEQQGRTIERLSGVLELFVQKAEIHDEAFKDRLQEIKLVIDSFAEANRTNTGILRDLRDKVLALTERRSS